MKRTVISFLLVLCLFPSLSYALTGKVVSVADGDTITILDNTKTKHKIRLYGIDTPEKKQAFGKSAKKYTASLTAGKIVKVTAYDTDRYGRTVGVVEVNGLNVNRKLIEAGYAWQYRKYCKESFCSDWLQLEREAKVSMRGLWNFAGDPVPPWEWRKAKRSGKTSSRTVGSYTASPGGYHGNVKSHVVHAPNCRHYNCKNCSENFSTREAAISVGYRPCGQCKPW